MALQISGRLGLLGVLPSGDVAFALKMRLTAGDHGALWYYNQALQKRLRYEEPPVSWPKITNFKELHLQSEFYKPLTDAYGTIGGAWWMHDNPLPMRDSGALSAADAAFFLFKIPTVRVRSPPI